MPRFFLLFFVECKVCAVAANGEEVVVVRMELGKEGGEVVEEEEEEEDEEEEEEEEDGEEQEAGVTPESRGTEQCFFVSAEEDEAG